MALVASRPDAAPAAQRGGARRGGGCTWSRCSCVYAIALASALLGVAGVTWLTRVEGGDDGGGAVALGGGVSLPARGARAAALVSAASAAPPSLYVPVEDGVAELDGRVGEWEDTAFLVVGEDWFSSWPAVRTAFFHALFLHHPWLRLRVVFTAEHKPPQRALLPLVAMGYDLRALHMPLSELPTSGWWRDDAGRRWLAAAVARPAGPMRTTLLLDYVRWYALHRWGGLLIRSVDALAVRPLPRHAFVVEGGVDGGLAAEALRLPPRSAVASAALGVVVSNSPTAVDVCDGCTSSRALTAALTQHAAQGDSKVALVQAAAVWAAGLHPAGESLWVAGAAAPDATLLGLQRRAPLVLATPPSTGAGPLVHPLSTLAVLQSAFALTGLPTSQCLLRSVHARWVVGPALNRLQGERAVYLTHCPAATVTPVALVVCSPAAAARLVAGSSWTTVLKRKDVGGQGCLATQVRVWTEQQVNAFLADVALSAGDGGDAALRGVATVEVVDGKGNALSSLAVPLLHLSQVVTIAAVSPASPGWVAGLRSTLQHIAPGVVIVAAVKPAAAMAPTTGVQLLTPGGGAGGALPLGDIAAAVRTPLVLLLDPTFTLANDTLLDWMVGALLTADKALSGLTLTAPLASAGGAVETVIDPLLEVLALQGGDREAAHGCQGPPTLPAGVLLRLEDVPGSRGATPADLAGAPATKLPLSPSGFALPAAELLDVVVRLTDRHRSMRHCPGVAAAFASAPPAQLTPSLPSLCRRLWAAYTRPALEHDLAVLLRRSGLHRVLCGGHGWLSVDNGTLSAEQVAALAAAPWAQSGPSLRRPMLCRQDGGRMVSGDETPAQVELARKSVQLPGGRKLRIGFVTTASGDYNAFLPPLWESLKQHGFPHQEVHLFAFTDRVSEDGFLPDSRVHKMQHEATEWPFSVVARHFVYLRHADWLRSMDYLFAIDADSRVTAPLTEVMLSERVAVVHPTYFGRQPSAYPNDRRITQLKQPYSAAFISEADAAGQCYHTGGLFGGTADGFFAILKGTVELASADLARKPPRIALEHDESYLNRYFLSHPPTLTLSPAFMYPAPPADVALLLDPEVGMDWLRDGTPADDVAPDLPHPYIASRRFTPTVMNLGLRAKAVADSVARIAAPATATIPAVMAAGGVASALPIVSRPHVADVVTFAVKAFERRFCLTRLLESVNRYFPNVTVIVLDDSSEELLPAKAAELTRMRTLLPRLQIMRAPYDTGLAGGRNMMLQQVKTPYLLLLDDDFELLDHSRIEHLLAALEYGQFDLAGGCIDSAWAYYVLPEPGRLEIKMDMGCDVIDGTPHAPTYETDVVSCFRVDMINNFFMARTAFLRTVRWDPRLKMGEHEDFFLRVKQANGRVGLCRGITAKNDNSCDRTPVYKKLRGRVFDFWVIFFRKWNLKSMKTAAGVYTLLCNGTAGTAPPWHPRAGHEYTFKDGHAAVAVIPAYPSASEDQPCWIHVQQDNLWWG